MPLHVLKSCRIKLSLGSPVMLPTGHPFSESSQLQGQTATQSTFISPFKNVLISSQAYSDIRVRL